MLVYHYDELFPLGNTNSDFHSNRDSLKSTSDFLFTLGGEAISWRSVKQSYIDDSTMEVEYVVASKKQKKLFSFKSSYWDFGWYSWLYRPLFCFMTTVGQWHNLKNQVTIKRVSTLRGSIT